MAARRTCPCSPVASSRLFTATQSRGRSRRPLDCLGAVLQFPFRPKAVLFRLAEDRALRNSFPNESKRKPHISLGLHDKYRRFRLFSGFWGHVEAATVEVDRVHEVLPVPEAPRRVLHPLDLGIDGFAGRVSDPMPQVRDDVFESPFEHPRYLDHRLQPTPHCPVVPPAEVFAGRS